MDGAGSGVPLVANARTDAIFLIDRAGKERVLLRSTVDALTQNLTTLLD